MYHTEAMKFAISCALVALVSLAAPSANNSPLWLRYPAISPDGQTLLFEYKGDIWSVPAAGGNAIPLTLSESYDFAPVWSHDGTSVAFASDRYGNFDVFVMPSDGGEAKRLTYHSAREVPSSFTADNRAVLFSATTVRGHRATPGLVSEDGLLLLGQLLSVNSARRFTTRAIDGRIFCVQSSALTGLILLGDPRQDEGVARGPHERG
jgi:dipeptidyl aminopeptidase/acylaminoacyl peptidase